MTMVTVTPYGFIATTTPKPYDFKPRSLPGHSRSADPLVQISQPIANTSSSTPVWTAFITDNILSPDWMRLEDQRTICLRSFKRHIFAPRYNPPMHVDGSHMLEFISTRGMSSSCSLPASCMSACFPLFPCAILLRLCLDPYFILALFSNYTSRVRRRKRLHGLNRRAGRCVSSEMTKSEKRKAEWLRTQTYKNSSLLHNMKVKPILRERHDTI